MVKYYKLYPDWRVRKNILGSIFNGEHIQAYKANKSKLQTEKFKEKLTFTSAQMCISKFFLNPEDKLLEFIIF